MTCVRVYVHCLLLNALQVASNTLLHCNLHYITKQMKRDIWHLGFICCFQPEWKMHRDSKTNILTNCDFCVARFNTSRPLTASLISHYIFIAQVLIHTSCSGGEWRSKCVASRSTFLIKSKKVL